MTNWNWLVVLACVACVGTTGFAQDKGKAKEGAKSSARREPPPFRPIEQVLAPQVLAQLKEQTRSIDVAPPASTGVKDLEEVAKMLQELEIVAEAKEYMGFKYIWLPEYYIDVFLGGEGPTQMLFVRNWAVEMKDLATATPDKLLGLMEYNGGLANCMYASKSQGILVLAPIEARMVNRGALKRRVDAVNAVINQTRSIMALLK